jgi:hypothetical protein
VNAVGKFHPYRKSIPNPDIRDTLAYKENQQEIERIICQIYRNNLGPKPAGEVYSWKSEEEITRILKTDRYLTSLALAIVLNEEL